MVLSSCFCEGGRPAIYAHSVQPGIKAYSSWLGSKRPPRMLLGLSAYIGYLSSVHLTTPDHSSSYCYCAVRISCVDTTNVSWHNRRVTEGKEETCVSNLGPAKGGLGSLQKKRKASNDLSKNVQRLGRQPFREPEI